MKRGTPTVAIALVVASGCGFPLLPGAAPPRAQPLVSQRDEPRPSVSNVPAWTYWQPVDAPLVAPSLEPVELPVLSSQLTFLPGAEARWAAASPALRAAIESRGFAVARPAHPTARLGDFYGSVRDTRTPWVVTLDVLFFLAHLALDRALADVDAYVVAPLVSTMLHRLESRLVADGRPSHADLTASYVMARAIVAVALGLIEPHHDSGPEFERIVGTEKGRALEHEGTGISTWLGTPVDYSALAPVGMADRDDNRAGWFRALAWLENVSLAMEGAGEGASRTRLDVAAARVQARCALLLARALDAGVDAEAANAWDRLERAGQLMVDETDAVTPRELSAAAARADVDPRSQVWLGNVVPVDRVRHAIARGRDAAAFRLLGPRATPDTEVLRSLTFPSVGARRPATATVTWSLPDVVDRAPAPVHSVRTLPTALDIAAWLGSGEARALLRDSGYDAYDRYDETLDHAIRMRRPERTNAERHRSPYLSMLDAIETWLAPSAGDSVQPAASTSEWRKRKVEVALAAWTELRHDATSLTRIPLGEASLPASSPELAPVPAFVEPHPEAIAKLAGVVRQARRALVTEGELPHGSPALRFLDEVDDLLWTALGAAVYEAADEALPPRLESALSTFPSRLIALERALADAGSAEVPLAADVHADNSSSLVLEEVTGRIDEAWVVMREPATHRLVLALGASIPHYELVQPGSRRQSDTAWRTRLNADGDPPLGLLERAYSIPSEPTPL